MPKMSVLMPVYQGERYLRDTLASVVRQTFSDFEILIRDDGSTDKTLEIIQEFDDPRIRLLRRGPSERNGLFHNLNALVHASQARYIHILCQDDLMAPDCLEQEYNFFLANPEVAFVYCSLLGINEKGEEIGRTDLYQLPLVIQPEFAQQLYYHYGCLPGNLSPVCLNRETLLNEGGFDPEYTVAGDFECWVRLSRKHPIGLIRARLVSIRSHPQQLSQKRSSIVPFIKQCNLIFDALEKDCAYLRTRRAKLFRIFNINVLDVHAMFRLVLAGEFTLAWRAGVTLGLRRTLLAFPAWLITVNRRWRPVGLKFKLTPVEEREHAEVSRLSAQERERRASA